MPEAAADRCDVAVVGAGRAGLTAAAFCARNGLATVLLDARPHPGGEAEREGARAARAKLVRECAAAGVRQLPGVRATHVSEEHGVAIAGAEGGRVLDAVHVVLATGSRERPFAFQGDALAGVMPVHAAQGLLAPGAAGIAGPVVLAGGGPLLWQFAARLLKRGVPIAALLDMRPPARVPLGAVAGFAFSPYVWPGVRLMMRLRRQLEVVPRVTSLAAEGAGALRAVRYRTRSGAEGALPAATLIVHAGLIPDIDLARDSGLALEWDAVQQAWRPRTNAFGGSSVPGIYVAGDAAGVIGAQAAGWHGLLCAADIVHTVAPDAARKAAALASTALSRYRRGRRFIDLYFRCAGEGSGSGMHADARR